MSSISDKSTNCNDMGLSGGIYSRGLPDKINLCKLFNVVNVPLAIFLIALFFRFNTVMYTLLENIFPGIDVRSVPIISRSRRYLNFLMM